MNNLINEKIIFHGLRGVGTMELEFEPDQRVYTIIGENGVGKTKLLEALFTVLFRTNSLVDKVNTLHSLINNNIFDKITIGSNINYTFEDSVFLADFKRNLKNIEHSYPVVYLATQNRGNIDDVNETIEQIGGKEQRQKEYLEYICRALDESNRIKTVGMDTNINKWFIQRAQSENPYQISEDNRGVEIDTLLKLLHNIDHRFSQRKDDLKISGDGKVFINIDKKQTALSDLSSGFASILKILQSIVSGYSYFTNAENISEVEGYVLIDEIESHLHNEWQIEIISLLKKIFPNTTFFITTHSSIVLSQLKEGEAYRLQRDEDDVVRAHLIKNPDKMLFIDLLKDAFGVDLNEIRIKNTTPQSQKIAKQNLLKLIAHDLENIYE